MITSFDSRKKLNPKDFLNYGGQYLILREAEKRGVNSQILFQHKHGKRAIYIRLTKDHKSRWVSHQKGFFNSKLACELALSKYLTNSILERYKLPVIKSERINSAKQILDLKLKYPVVIKPNSQTMGRDVHVKIKNRSELLKIANRLFKKHKYLIIENFIKGKDYRLFVIGNRVAATVRRIPTRIIGDGQSTIKELIMLSNQKERRLTPKKLLPFKKKIKIDLEIKRALAQKGLRLNSILKKDQVLQIRKNANFSTGGEAEDVTKLVHPDNKRIAVKATKALGLEIAGVDIIMPDISKSIKKSQGKIIEINAIPSLWIHHFPNIGQGRNVAGKIIDYLFKS